MKQTLRAGLALVAALHGAPGLPAATFKGPCEVAFSRIVRGWTNYSTAFNATHDLGSAGDFASVASFFTPTHNLCPAQYGVIVIWDGSGNQRLDFNQFGFRVSIWSSLEAFVADPREGDIAAWDFSAPTGGNTSVPDTTTRGGRPAYEIRFHLSNPAVTLEQGREYLIGFAARTVTSENGELYVPTAASTGASDVQAGDLVPGGWRHVVNGGGSTIYSGQMAVECIVQAMHELPVLTIERRSRQVLLSWPAAAEDFALEYTQALTQSPVWRPIEEEPIDDGQTKRILLPAVSPRQWFRLERSHSNVTGPSLACDM